MYVTDIGFVEGKLLRTQRLMLNTISSEMSGFSLARIY